MVQRAAAGGDLKRRNHPFADGRARPEAQRHSDVGPHVAPDARPDGQAEPRPYVSPDVRADDAADERADENADDGAHVQAVHRAHEHADVPPDRRPDGQALGRAHVLAAAERVAHQQTDGRADGATLWVAHRRPDDRADLRNVDADASPHGQALGRTHLGADGVAAAVRGADHRADVVPDAAALLAADILSTVVGADEVSVDAGDLDVHRPARRTDA